jgi:glycosyltransferase involved in cell wall biosynthesis
VSNSKVRRGIDCGPIRVLQSVSSMGYGGIEHFIMNVFRSVDRDQVEFDFMYRENSSAVFDEEIQDLGGRIFRFASPDKHPFKSTQFYRDFFAEHSEYRIVHEHRSSLFGLLGCLRAASYEHVSTRVIHAHNSKTSNTGFRGMYESVTRKQNEAHISEIATHFFACSDAAATWMFPSSTGVSNRVQIIPNGIDANRFRFNKTDRFSTRKELNIPENAFVIGHVGRFVEPKNHTFLLDVLAAFPRESRPYLLLLGQGDLMDDMKAKANSLGIDNCVVFAGVRNDTWRCYSAMDVFCMPSLFEGLPVSAVEAQANGLPLLLSDTVSRDSDIGGLVRFKSLGDGARSWAEELIDLHAHEIDRDNGVTTVVNAGFDVASVADWLQQFYLTRFEEGEK